MQLIWRHVMHVVLVMNLQISGRPGGKQGMAGTLAADRKKKVFAFVIWQAMEPHKLRVALQGSSTPQPFTSDLFPW